MADVFTKEKRSWIMSRIRGKNTKIEKLVESWLRKNKINFRKHYKMVGNPDFTMPKKKIAVFIDGDFWHGYDYQERRRKLPVYWKEKIKKNMERDKRINKELRKLGWKVIRIWEHTIIKKPKNLNSKFKDLVNK